MEDDPKPRLVVESSSVTEVEKVVRTVMALMKTARDRGTRG